MKILFVVIVSLCALYLTGCKSDQDKNNANYTAYETNYTNNQENHINIVTDGNDINTEIKQNKAETELATFSTKIMYKDENREHNMSLTCSKLNGIIVKQGEIFSFCNTVGKATAEAGYKEADIFDKEGNVKKGYGGGNCQVSSTLYNAILQIPNLEVIERHEHSRKVNYVESGKDAAVAYGSIDFRFKNENDYDIKIYSETTENTVDIRIVKLENV